MRGAPGKDRERAQRWWVWLAPLCFTLFPILSLYAANIAEVTPAELLRPAALALGATLVLGLILAAALRNAPRAAVLLAAASFLFFSYGQLLLIQPLVQRVLYVLLTSGREVDPHVYCLPLWAGISVATIVLGLRSRRDFTPLATLLVLVGATLIAPPALTIATHRGKTRRPLEAPPAPAANPAPVPAADGPDIYYIVLDAYGRQDILKEFYGYDNEPFLRELEKRGFYIARQARPNYAQTPLSLASSLNMTYLDAVARAEGVRSRELGPLSRMVDRNAVAAFLRARGYRFVAITNEFPPTRVTSADLVLEGEPPEAPDMTPFDGLLLQKTPFAAIPHAERSLYEQHRATIDGAFDRLAGAPRLPYRKFVYAHILAPHPPFVFSPDGKPMEPSGRPFTLGDASDFTRNAGRDEYRRGYVGQLQYVNRRLLASLDAIFAGSDRRPIVLVQGDHGPRMLLDWQSLDRSEPREAFANLAAFSLPDGSAGRVFYPGISPVNSFRLLFNHGFGTHYPRLPDRSYYSTLQAPYAFTDVTRRTSVGLTPPVPPLRGKGAGGVRRQR